MRSTHDIIDPITLSILNNLPKGNLFDYGCGDCLLTNKISKLGFSIEAFDIDTPTIKKAKKKYKDIVIYTKNQFDDNYDMFMNRFDVVLCSLVVCVVEDDIELKKIIHSIKYLLKPQGFLLLSFCNPKYTYVRETDFQEKYLPKNFKYENKIVFNKKLKYSEIIRRDVHRPIEFYLELLKNNKFEILEIRESAGKNLKTGEYASDFIWLLLINH